MVFKFESRAEATALLKRRSRDAAVAMLNKEFTAQRWTLRKELKLSVRPLVTLRYFRRAVGAVRAPAPGPQRDARSPRRSPAARPPRRDRPRVHSRACARLGVRHRRGRARGR